MSWLSVFGVKSESDKQEIEQAKNALLKGFQYTYSALQQKRHPFYDLIDFFNGTSEIQDNLDVIEKVIKAHGKGSWKKNEQIFKAFSEKIVAAGRKTTGLNRTEKGQRVNETNVFLGNIMGLFTQSISDWNKTEYADVNHKGEYNGTKLDYNPITQQASEFVTSYKTLPDDIKQILELLGTKV